MKIAVVVLKSFVTFFLKNSIIRREYLWKRIMLYVMTFLAMSG